MVTRTPINFMLHAHCLSCCLVYSAVECITTQWQQWELRTDSVFYRDTSQENYVLILCSTGTHHTRTILWESVLQEHITKELFPEKLFYRNTSQKNYSLRNSSTGTLHTRTVPWESGLQEHITKELCPESLFYVNISQCPTEKHHRRTIPWESVLQGHIRKELCPDTLFYRNTPQNSYVLRLCSKGILHKITMSLYSVLQEHFTK